MKISFLGLGIMGKAMSANLARAGFSVNVWNRNAAAAESLAALGCRIAADPIDAVRDADVVGICVTNEESVNDVLFRSGASEHLGAGAIVSDFSTIAPAAAKSFASELSSRGISYLDSPVTGGDVGARNATLSIMVGGDEVAYRKVLPIYEKIGKTIVYMGPSGNGQLMKCVNQIAIALGVMAMTESLLFAKGSGLDQAKALEVMNAGSAGSWSMQNYAPRVLRGELGPGFYARDMLKDLRYALSEAKNHGRELPGLQLAESLYSAFVGGEGRELGNHALIRLYERESNSYS